MRFVQLLGKSIFLSLIAREIYLLADAKPVVTHIFLAMGREMNLKGGRMVALRIPSLDHDEPIKVLRRRLTHFGPMLARTGVTYLEADKEITQIPHWKANLYLTDGHMNAQGIKLLAEYLFERVFENR